MARHVATGRTRVPRDPPATRYDTGSTAVAHRGRTDPRTRFGGIDWGGCFFGWLVAVAVTILLMSIVGAVASGVGASMSLSQSDAQRRAGSIGTAAAIVLVAVLVIGYFTGGYVAGRMSRSDGGGRQGVGVWVTGLLGTAVAVGLGAVFGAEYNLLDRVDLPRIPASTEDLAMATGAAVTAVVVVLGTLAAATVGGVLGCYDRTDADAGR